MKYFIVGVVVTILVPLIGALAFFKLGLMAVNADAHPGTLERRIANLSLDASVHRNAPAGNNPLPDNDETLVRGVKLYKNNCAECHGGPDGTSEFGRSFYPPAPQFSFHNHPSDDPDNEMFYVIKHGIRMTGMPSFGSQIAKSPLLKDDEIWAVVRFLKTFPALSPAAEAVWKAGASATPPTATPAEPSGAPSTEGSAQPAPTASGAVGSPAP